MKDSSKIKKSISTKAFIVKSEENQKELFSGTAKKDITDDVIREVYPKLQKKVEAKINNEISKLTNNLTSTFISVLGIFASIVTFLLIEISILKNVCDFWRLIGFSAFILGGLLSFLICLNYLIKDKNSQNKNPYPVIILILFLFTIFVISMSKAQDEYNCKVANLENNFEKLELKLRKELKNEIDIDYQNK